MADHNPGYIREYQHTDNYIWELNHLGIKLDLLDKMKILRYLKDKMHEKDSNPRKRWDKGLRHPDPYDEAAVHCAAISECLDKCHDTMQKCLNAEAALETEQYLYRQASSKPPQLSDDPMKETRLAEAKEIFKDAKKKFVDSMNPKKNRELSELVYSLK